MPGKYEPADYIEFVRHAGNADNLQIGDPECANVLTDPGSDDGAWVEVWVYVSDEDVRVHKNRKGG